jgi:hypothetical protein
MARFHSLLRSGSVARQRNRRPYGPHRSAGLGHGNTRLQTAYDVVWSAAAAATPATFTCISTGNGLACASQSSGAVTYCPGLVNNSSSGQATPNDSLRVARLCCPHIGIVHKSYARFRDIFSAPLLVSSRVPFPRLPPRLATNVSAWARFSGRPLRDLCAYALVPVTQTGLYKKGGRNSFDSNAHDCPAVCSAGCSNLATPLWDCPGLGHNPHLRFCRRSDLSRRHADARQRRKDFRDGALGDSRLRSMRPKA